MRMLEQRQQRRRRGPAQRGLDRKAGENAGGCVGERLPAGIGDDDVPPGESRRNAARKRAVGRRERRRAFGRFDRFAQRNGDRERFLVGVRSVDHGQAREASRELLGEGWFSETRPPQIGRRRRTQRFRDERGAIVRGRVPEYSHLAAVEAKLLQ